VSVGTGDGRTYFAANLALALAQMGRRTLLIEADLRGPRLAGMLPGMDRSTGLSGVLTGRQRLADAISMPVGLPNSANLFVLPAGDVLREPLELLQQPSFTLLLDKVAAHFDHVLIDTPAVSNWVDARLVTSRAGTALLVARPDQTRMADLDRLMRTFRRSGAEIAGVVMNPHR
jgi:protein-tyrosine kinase